MSTIRKVFGLMRMFTIYTNRFLMGMYSKSILGSMTVAA